MERDRFGNQNWVAPVRSFGGGKSSPAQPASNGTSAAPKRKQTPLVSPRGREGFVSAASNGSSAFSPVTPREAMAAPSAPKSGDFFKTDFLRLNAQTSSSQSPEHELAHVALRCMALSDQLSAAKEQLRESSIKIEGLERHMAFSKESFMEAVNGRDALAKQFQEYKESTKKLVEGNQRNTLLLKQQIQAQSESERAHNAQIARMNAQHQEALDILREKLNAAASSSAINHTRASELNETLTRTEAVSAQELQLLRSRLAACEVAERTVLDGGGDFSAIITKLTSADTAAGEEAAYEKNQLAARAAAAMAGIIRERDELLREAQAVKADLGAVREDLSAALQREASSRSQFEDFITELQRQLSSSMRRESEALARAAELSKELEDTTSSSVGALSASAQDISALRSRLSECEAERAALKEQLTASEYELSEVHSTLSQALESDSDCNSAPGRSSSIEAEILFMRVALKESMDKEARARSLIVETESKLASSQAVEAAARTRVGELEAAAKLWDVFVQEHARKSQASVQLQSLLAAKSALADQQEKEISSLRQRVVECDSSIVDANATLEAVQGCNAALQEQLAGTCFELEEVHAALGQTAERERAAVDEYAVKELEFRLLIGEYEARLSENKTVEEAASNCVLELQAALKLNKESLSARAAEVEKYRGQIAELEDAVARQCCEIEALKHELADCEISKISANDELVSARNEVAVLTESRQQSQAALEALKTKMQDAQSEIESLNLELSFAKAEADSNRASLKDTTTRESRARQKEMESAAKNKSLVEKLRLSEIRVREMEIQVETQTEFAASSAKVSAAMRDACSHSETLIEQMKKNLALSASNEASARKLIAQLEGQVSGYENYFAQQMQESDHLMFGIGLFIVSMNVAAVGFSTPRSSPLTPGKNGSTR
jgi:chromosome segregation ATPase